MQMVGIKVKKIAPKGATPIIYINIRTLPQF